MAAWTRENVAYMAALFEGEGCVQPNPLRVKFAMTDEDVIRGFRERVGFGCVTGPLPPSGLGKKDRWLYSTSGRRAYALLMAMYPFLYRRRQEQVRTHVATWMQQRSYRLLKPSDVAQIKAELRDGSHGTARRLARQYGVSDALISAIRKGRAWKKVMPNV